MEILAPKCRGGVKEWMIEAMVEIGICFLLFMIHNTLLFLQTITRIVCGVFPF